MNKIIVSILFSMLVINSVFAQNLPIQPKKPVLSGSQTTSEEEIFLPNIYIYSAPTPTGDEVKLNDSDKLKVNDTENPYVRYDDSSVARHDYSLDSEDVVELTGVSAQNLNLKRPQYAQKSDMKFTQQKTVQKSTMPYVYRGEEYSIQPLSKNEVAQTGHFKYGTTYGAAIDTSQLEYTAGLFTRYERQRFALSTAYQKNQGTAYGLTTDNFYLSPEFKLNNTLSISNVMKADTTRNRRTSELVLKIKPFANRGNDRVNMEFGAGQTYDENNALYKTQFRFNTNIQL